MFKLINRLICAVLLAALLLALPVAAETAVPQFYYPTGGVAKYTLTEIPATGDAPQLTLQDDRTLEEIIVEGLRNVEEVISIPYGSLPANQEEIKRVYFGIVKAHPEFFYVGNGASYAVSSDYVVSISPKYDENLAQPEVIAAFNAHVEEILSETTSPGMSQLEIALSLHDYLVLHCAYDWSVLQNQGEPSYNVYTAYGALIEGNAVCQGYAMAYNLLLNKVGIETEYVTSSTINHGWSLVEIDGTWYHVDVTWDDPTMPFSDYNHDLPGYCIHKYFLVSTEGMADHGDFTVSHATTDTYESGYVFCGAKVPFFWMAGAFYYIGANNSLQSATDLQTGPAASSYSVLAQRYGSTLFSLNYSYSSGTVYGYDMPTKQRYAVTTLDSISGYGLAKYEDGIYLVKVEKSAGATPMQKLQLPLDDRLHCGEPVVDAAVTVSIRNGQQQARTVFLCLAAYNDAGQLLSLGWEDIKVASGESKEAVFSLPSSNVTKAVVFYLDETLLPLREAATVTP